MRLFKHKKEIVEVQKELAPIGTRERVEQLEKLRNDIRNQYQVAMTAYQHTLGNR